MADLARDKQLTDLSMLIDVSRQLGVSTELDPLLKRIEEASLKILDCERASVFLYDKATNELYSKIATGVAEIRFPAAKGIAGEAAQSRRIINVPDAYADSRFNPAVDKTTGYRTRNMLALAMIGYDDQLMGVLQLLNKRAEQFSEEDEHLAEALSATAGVAIQRQLLLEEYAEKQRLERDLDLAREIQRGYLPNENPSIDGYDVGGWNKPADQTGGDAYDYIPCGDRLGLLIADATGHGIGPALMVAECRAMIRVLASSVDDIARIMSSANMVMADDLKDGRFVTACLALMDPPSGAIEFLSAGHGPLLHYCASDDRFIEIPASTVPMGILKDFPCTETTTLTLQRGDIFVLVTDGFFEWQKPNGDQFGLERLQAVIREHRAESCQQIIDVMHRSAEAFGEGTPQLDDLTAILVKRT